MTKLSCQQLCDGIKNIDGFFVIRMFSVLRDESLTCVLYISILWVTALLQVVVSFQVSPELPAVVLVQVKLQTEVAQ